MRLAIPAVLLLACFGCSSNKNNTASADEYVVDCTVDMQQFASDESFVKFIEAEAARRVTADDCKSPELLGPVPGSTLSASTPPMFIFRGTHTCAADQSAIRPQRYALGTRRTPPMWVNALRFVSELVEGNAEAHCGAFTGENYLLRITQTGDSASLYTALLSVNGFQPDPSIWRRALSGRSGRPISVTIERGIFLHGIINDGPYVQGQPYSFPVGP